jgi:N-acetylglucosaminyldiphosphoundecaprenol N-acetyl-beta-D-mannosaminyltransferase
MMNMLEDVQTDSAHRSEDKYFSILGVNILNVTINRALALLENHIVNHDGRTRSVYFVNAHTLNLAAADPEYRAVLNSGDYVFGDGTGVRWAAKLKGVRVLDNLVGTDFTPKLLRKIHGRENSYYMLGSNEHTVSVAARYGQEMFPGWSLHGYHQGYLNTPEKNSAAIEKINAAKPDVLFVGMGNPIQERWIHQNLPYLKVPVCMGIGGLFDYWAGNVSRAPKWLRRLGHEWIWRLFQQPKDKMHRYLVGNPLFLARIMREGLFGAKVQTPKK